MIAYQLEGVETAPRLADPAFAREQGETGRGGPVKFPVRAPLMELPKAESDRATLRRVVAEIATKLPPRAASAPARVPVEEFARAACAWLDQRHSYSLQSTIPGGSGDPLVRWITSDVPGHCELFAGAFVVLARTAGYPTRLVSGFMASSWNGISNNLTVRDSDAHAWCEVWDGAGAWLRVDPTPGAATVGNADELRGETAIAGHLDRSWKARLDSLRIFWYRRIVNFDQRNQIDTLRAFRTATQETGARLRLALERRIERAKQWLQSPWSVRRLALVLGAAASLAFIGWAGRWLLRRWRWRSTVRDPGRPDPVRVDAGRWLRRLRAQQSQAVAVAELERLRYGARPSWPEPEAVFRRAQHAWREAKRSGRRK